MLEEAQTFKLGTCFLFDRIVFSNNWQETEMARTTRIFLN